MTRPQSQPSVVKNQNQSQRQSIKSTTLSPSQIEPFIRKLESHLPYSIPLLRRIQFHQAQQSRPSHRSESARIFVAAVVGDDETSKQVGGLGMNGTAPLPEIEVRDGDEDAGAAAESEEASFLDSWLLNLQRHDHARPWLVAHIDLVNSGQTQVWLFGSWEADPSIPLPSASREAVIPPSASSPTRSQDTLITLTSACQILSTLLPSSNATHNALIRTLFKYIHSTLIPQLPTTPPEDWLSLERSGKYLSKPYDRSKILFGTVSEKLWGLFDEEARTRTDDGYWKYIFRIEPQPQPQPQPQLQSKKEAQGTVRHEDEHIPTVPSPSLRPDYTFNPLREQDLQTVLDRTPIPRTLNTLRQYVSIGLFHASSPDPVGWGFLGKDASLSSLHTEPEHRGKGLAVALGAELLRRRHVKPAVVAAAVRREEAVARLDDREREWEFGHAAGPDAEGSDGGWSWAHADVSKSNVPSRRVMEKLGGKPMWMVLWTELDLEKVMATT